MKAWVTQASRDDGVDAVATNGDPVVGGLVLSRPSAIATSSGGGGACPGRGMADKAASKGILVTTSWFGKASLDFAARTGRTGLVTGRELKACSTEVQQPQRT